MTANQTPKSIFLEYELTICKLSVMVIHLAAGRANVIYRISMVRDNCFVPRAMMSESNFQKCAPDPHPDRSSSPQFPLPPPLLTQTLVANFPGGLNLDTD